MSEEEEKERTRGFKVEDRRRFSESGEARAQGEDHGADAAAPNEGAAADPGTAREAAAGDSAPLELNFSTFVISLSTQALAHLGEIPNPIDNQTAVDLGAAKQLIDILGILKEKSKGNLDQTEAGLLENVLYDLRMRYVERVHARGGKA